MSRNRWKILALASVSLFAGGILLAPGAAHANKGECSQPFTAGTDPSASDCLFILSAAVGNSTCDNPCICSPKGTLPPRATDALFCLNYSVGAGTADNCPCADLKGYTFDPAAANVMANPGVQNCMVATDYIGAFDQGVSPDTGDWTLGWSVYLHGNEWVWEPATGGTLNGAVPTATGTCPVGTVDIGDTPTLPGAGGKMDICQLAARYLTNLTLTNDNVYQLGGTNVQGTFIGDGDAAGKTPGTATAVALTIEPGTLILGVTQDALKITRGSTINAVGTPVDPIVMTAKQQFDTWVAGGNPDIGDKFWGGLILTGFGQANTCTTTNPPCDALVEGVTPAFSWGGNDETISSGTVQYVVIAQGGYGLVLNSEINGLTVYGLSSNTTIDHVQIHDNSDDGLEIFGGIACPNHILLTSNADDNIDTDEGFRGAVQFALVKQTSEEADKGFEIDNKTTGVASLPHSAGTYANVSVMSTTAVIGNPTGVGLRSGVGAHIWNTLAQNAELACIRSEQGSVLLNGGTNSGADLLQMHNAVINCATEFASSLASGETIANVQTWYQSDLNNRTGVDPTLSATGYPGSPTNP